MANSAKTFCTTREAAALLSVSVTTTQNWVEAGLLEAWKTEGGHRRITRASVLRLINEPRSQRNILRNDGGNAPAPGHLHILLIEDDASIRQLYQEKMKHWAFSPTVDSAGDGFEALIKIGIRCPDLLISHLDMAHIDGLKMFNALAAMPICQNMTLLAITDTTREAIEQAGRSLPDRVRLLPQATALQALENIAGQLAEQKWP